MRKHILAEMNADDVKKTVGNDTIVVLIFGACGNHGDRCLLTQTLFLSNLPQDLPRSTRTWLSFPPLLHGASSHLKDFYMTISLGAETMITLIGDILLSLVYNGITRVLIINGHDGNIAPIELVARSVKENNPDVLYPF